MKRLLDFCHLAFDLDMYKSRNSGYHYRLFWSNKRVPDLSSFQDIVETMEFHPDFLLFWMRRGTFFQGLPLILSKCFWSFLKVYVRMFIVSVCVVAYECVRVWLGVSVCVPSLSSETCAFDQERIASKSLSSNPTGTLRSSVLTLDYASTFSRYLIKLK